MKEDIKDLPLIAPGLVDLQVNGFGGIDFNQGPVGAEKLQTNQLISYFLKGVSCFFATLITQDHKHADFFCPCAG